MTQRRIFQCSFPYFITFNVFDGGSMFEDIKKAEILHKIILKAGELKNHFVYQFCIMPDHVHILCKTEPLIPQSGFCRADFEEWVFQPAMKSPRGGSNNLKCGSDIPSCSSGDQQSDQSVTNVIAGFQTHSAICKNNCDCGQIHKSNISDFIKSIRGTFSRMIYEGQIWHPRFYDQIIENEERLSATIDYITDNPIKAGLSRRWQKYPYQFKNDELINDLF
jgi:REP element-mobilizing transposase RayT